VKFIARPEIDIYSSYFRNNRQRSQYDELFNYTEVFAYPSTLSAITLSDQEFIRALKVPKIARQRALLPQI
jgi:hypothetical protein